MGYKTATVEEYLALPQDNSLLMTKLSSKALEELKNSKNHADKLNKTLKKYLINSTQASTNAKIVEELLK